MPTLRPQLAFTLIELLVVIAIIATLAGITLASGWTKHDEMTQLVENAARGVERKLLEARNLALVSGKPHCVVFHIENAGSGAILRNRAPEDTGGFPGRHWCAVIGPAKGSEILPRMPWCHESNLSHYGSAQRLELTVGKSQIGDRFYLPKGTRFLALGDAEDNLNNPGAVAIPTNRAYYSIPVTGWTTDTRTRTGIAALSTTYPRPYFGYLEGSGAPYTMRAFAGYDHAIYGSGLDYECTTRNSRHDHSNGKDDRIGPYPEAQTGVAVINSTNTALCSCWAVPSAAAANPAVNTLLEEMRPCCDQHQLSQTDKDGNLVPHPRPVVNGLWMDYAIVFLADGQARALCFYNRQILFSGPTGSVTSRTTPKRVAQGDYSRQGLNLYFNGRDDAIIHVLGEAIGGPSITIARDAPDDSPTFTSPQQALRSIMPMRRVVVSEPTGGVRTIRPFVTIQAWLDAIEEGIPEAQRIWKNGWEYCAVTDPHPNKIRVTGAVQADMLTQRDPYPWIKPQ